MDLILWRHAQAEDGAHDAQRALTDKGRAQAQAMAAWLKRCVPGPVKVLSSPAVRACETAAAYAADVATSDALAPGAGAPAILQAAGWPDGKGTIVVVGHQPALGAAIALAIAGKPAPWPLRKGALWWLRSDGANAPRVVAVMTPRLARASIGKAR
jgi:phosphohistidine phosphatase